MQISSAITLLLVAGATAANVTYNVVSLALENQTMGVVVDNNVYPLQSSNETSILLHTGDAPAASTGYRYAILDKTNTSNVVSQEDFVRNPVSEKKTLNEYYGRSWNTKNLTQLPIIMSPLPIIHRIDSELHVDGEIPTIHLTGNQSAVDYMHNNNYADIDTSDLKMTYINPRDVKTFENVTLSLSGFSSRSFAKLSYKLAIPKKGGDLYDYRRFKLRSMGSDMSYMRESLAYDTCRSVGLPCPGYSYVRLYINDQPLGLFGFADNMKNPWQRNEFGDGDKDFEQGATFIANPGSEMNASILGQLFSSKNGLGALAQGLSSGNQAVRTDLSFLGDNVTLYEQSWKAREDPSKGEANYTRIMEMTKFISQQPNVTSDDSAVALWDQHMDVTSFLRGIAFEVAVCNTDSYLTTGNNYVLFDDLTNERLVYSNQDLDTTMGTHLFNTDLMFGGNYTNFPGILTRPLTTRMLAVPQFKKEFDNLMYNYTRDLVNTDIFSPRIDALYDLLKEDVAWDKTCPRVGKIDFFKGFTNISIDDVSFEAGINGSDVPQAIQAISMGVKSWIELRTANLQNFFANQSTSVA